MSILRTDQQVALNDLFVATQVSADHYHEAAEFLDEPDVALKLRRIGDNRQELAERVEEAIRATGDLPSAPNKDVETGETLIQWLRAAFSPDEVESVLHQRLDAEQELQELVDELCDSSLKKSHNDLLTNISNNIREAIQALEEMLEQHS